MPRIDYEITNSEPIEDPQVKGNISYNANYSSSSPSAPDMTSILRSFVSSNSLSVKAKDYIESIKTQISKYEKIKIKCETISIPVETVYFTCEHYCFILIFTESIGFSENKIAGAFIPAVIDVVRKVTNSKYKILNTVEVTKDMYDRSDQMFVHIVNMFLARVSKEVSTFNAHILRTVNKWHIDITPESYNHYINKISPHGIPARNDIGFLFSMENRNRNIQAPGILGKDQIDTEPLGAATGYVEWIYVTNNDTTGMPKLMPIIHITDIVTNVMIPSILTVFMPAIASTFLYKKLWQIPYSDISQNGKNPYIGSLVKDHTTNRPLAIENMGQLEQFYRTFTLPPVLCIDVTEGRARIPGIERYARMDEVVTKSIITESLDFFNEENTQVNIPNNVLVTDIINEITGYINTPDGAIDSRWVDYLNVIKTHPQDWDELQELLIRNGDPTLRVTKQRSIHNNFEQLFINRCCILSGHYITFLLDKIRNYLNVTDNITQNVGSINTQGFAQNAQSYYANFNGGLNSGYPSGINMNYMNIYGN